MDALRKLSPWGYGRIACWTLALVSVAVWMTGFLGGIAPTIGWLELPLSSPTNAVVNSTGDVFCGSEFFQRVQVYDRSGNFLRAWQAPSGGGTFVLELTPQDEIVVVAAREAETRIFDARGTLLRTLPRNRLLAPQANARFSTDAAGNRFEIAWSALCPTIVRHDRAGQQHPFAGPNPLLFLAFGPLITWLCMVLGCLAAKGCEWMEWLQDHRLPPPPQSEALSRSENRP